MFKMNMRSMQLFKGVLAIVLVKVITSVFRLSTLDFLVDSVINWGVLAIIIIFQPEIRTILEKIGQTKVRPTSQLSDDEKDRVIVKNDGTYTYLLPDIAYHVNKIERGYQKLIDVLGADHHGYINRLKGSLEILGHDSSILDIEILQMVRLLRDGENSIASVKRKSILFVFFEQLKASDPDVKSTESGLHYKVIQQGEGQNAYMGGRVRFHYRASFADGRVFDQTYGVREPILTVLNNIFPGLQEGLMMMNAKSKYVFYIPSHLAFGHQGTTDVPPYSTVIYEVELLQVLQ